MEFDELVNELVNWEEVDLVLEDAVVLDNGKEGFSDTWKSWTPSEFECLSPSAVLEFADKREECESFGRVDHHAPDTFLDYGVPADDVSPGVSSPGSCLSAPEAAGYGVPPGHEFGPESFRPDSSGARIDLELKEVSLGNLSCGESYPEFKSSSPESGCNSHSDDQVQAQERSRGQTANRGTGHEQDASPPMDEEAKRKMRLMRNRESATQSRLRKKSYIKELEMKCRMLESHCSMLQQTVAFTSRENVLLRDELNKIKCSNMNGSKSGVVEPAALPSDSLPSESPRRLTSLGPFRLANWELLACLYLVLLLPITGMKVQSPERGESRERRRRYRIKGYQVPWRSVLFTIVGNLGSLRWRMMSLRSGLSSCSGRTGKRILLGATETSQPATSVCKHHKFSKRRKHLRDSGRQRMRYGYGKRSFL